MKFNNDDLVEILRLTYQEKKSSRYIAELYGVGKSTLGDFLRRETYTDFWEAYDDKPVAGGEIHTAEEVRKSFSGKRYVFTSAQNNTHVHDSFLKSILGYCEYNDAELVVGTFHYNKKGFQNGTSEDTWFDPKIRKYILDESRLICKGLQWCGELNILPTAVNPISGLHNYTNRDSGIIPHAKLQLESLPTPKYDPCRIMYTTGTLTQRNYVEQKAGQKASHHHVFGGLVVEIDEDGDWFVRQLVCESDTGNFYDLDKYYTPLGVTEDCNIEGLNYGDIHSAKLDQDVADASWRNDDSVRNVLRPTYQFVHDVFDHKNRNHHNIGDPYFRFKMFVEGSESVKDEIAMTAGILEELADHYSEVIVVESNHDLALEKWLKEQDYKKDPVNAEIFLELQLAKYKAMRKGENLGTFEYACRLVRPSLNEYGINFLKTDDSFLICGDIECGNHGHNGNNGARATPRAFQMQGIRSNTGHTHSAKIIDGVYVSGVVGKLDQGYNTGGSSWSNSHIVTYTNGKRAILTLKNGKWRG